MTRGGKTFAEAQPKEDVVTLNNGDSLRGIVTDLNATQVVIQADAATTPLPLSSVTSIAFAASAGAAKSQAGYRVKFDDGESAVASSIALSGNTLQFSVGHEKPVQIELSHVVGIEQVNGPVSWLSSLRPVESIYTPYLGDRQTWPARMDESVSGEPLRFKEDVFSHGIGVHAYSRLSWALDGSFAAFRTRYAIEGEGSEGEHADVVVRIKLDGKTVYEQQHVRAGVLSPVDYPEAGRSEATDPRGGFRKPDRYVGGASTGSSRRCCERCRRSPPRLALRTETKSKKRETGARRNTGLLNRLPDHNGRRPTA